MIDNSENLFFIFDYFFIVNYKKFLLIENVNTDGESQ